MALNIPAPVNLVARVYCAHAQDLDNPGHYVRSCPACAIRWAINHANVAADARFVQYHGSLVEHHGLYAVEAAVDGRLCLRSVGVGNVGSDRVLLRGAGFASVTDVGYAGRYEAVDAADARAAARVVRRAELAAAGF